MSERHLLAQSSRLTATCTCAGFRAPWSFDRLEHKIFDRIAATVRGEQTASESLGHQEFILTYKSFEPIGPSCLPVVG